MPSPFPGMDPYLEGRGRWRDLHHRLITYAGEGLRPQLRPNYVARIEERVEISSLSSAYVPDLIVVARPGPRQTQRGLASAVADAPTTVRLLDPERQVPYIEIVHLASDRVVTVIEVLSPSNKSGEGRAEYLKKQGAILASQSSFVEIDLLSTGLPTVAARQVIPFDHRDSRYVVSVSRAGNRRDIEIYAFGLRDRLPRCGIPLLGGDADAVLDLPAVLSRAYELGDYDLVLDYHKPPPVALSDADTAWVGALLMDSGLVTA